MRRQILTEREVTLRGWWWRGGCGTILWSHAQYT